MPPKSIAVNNSEALAHLEKAIALDPNHLQARLALAELHRQGKRPKEAKRILKETISSNPDMPVAHTALAKLLIGEGENEQALDHLQAAAAGDLDDPDSRFQIAELLAANGRAKDAADQLTKVVELDPLNGEAHYRLAVLLEHPDDFDRAKLLFEISIDLLPDDSRPVFKLAQLLDRGEKNDREGNLIREPDQGTARRHYEHALSLSPNHGPTLLRLGSMLERDGDMRAANRHYNLASKIEKTAGEAFLRLAHLSRSAKEQDKVKKFLSLAANKENTQAQALLERAEIFFEQKKLKAAEEDLIVSLKAFERDETQFHENSKVAAENSNFVKARRCLEEADDARRSRAPGMLLMAKIKISEGEEELAISQLEKAKIISPRFAPVRYELAVLLDKQGRGDDAVSQYEATVEADWAYPDAHFRLGEIALAAKQFEKAEMHFLIVTDLDSAHKQAKTHLKTIATTTKATSKKPKT